MSLLLYCPVHPLAEVPNFGSALEEHLQRKKHPDAAAASRTAWKLLAEGLSILGVSPLPRIVFSEGGKPCFADHPLHFSLSHSGAMAAVLISDAPCGVDIERIREDVPRRLAERCLNEAELASNCDFFEVWTKKECMAKLDGSGMPSRPRQMNTLDPCRKDRFACMQIRDVEGRTYALAALCADAQDLKIVSIAGNK